MCPNCSEPMIILDLEGVEVDRCVRCGGTWLDAGELETITSLAGAEPGGLTRALEGEDVPAVPGGSGRRCPRCRRRLRTFRLAKVCAEIALERCPRGHGLWFDPGEMEATVRSCAEGQEGAVARFFTELYRGELARDVKGD